MYCTIRAYVCMCTYVCRLLKGLAQKREKQATRKGEADRTAVGADDDMTKHLDWVEAWLAILQRNLQSVDNTHTQEYITRTHGT